MSLVGKCWLTVDQEAWETLGTKQLTFFLESFTSSNLVPRAFPLKNG